MSIQVSCPNGHVLRVKDSFAGKSGYCPHCHAKVRVPNPQAFSEDDVIGVLGTPVPASPEDVAHSEAEEFVHQEPRPAEVHQHEESGIALYGSSIHQHPKVCPTCHKRASFSFSICPSCGTPLSSASESNRRTPH